MNTEGALNSRTVPYGTQPKWQVVQQATSNQATSNIVVDFSKRQREVLAAALDLMVEAGDALTMNAVASRANCSKETLYKWFGDRDGLLTATVKWQAAKVQIELPKSEGLNLERLHGSLKRFAARWLSVLSSDISIALNRTAVSHAVSSKSDLGIIVLTNGPFAMAHRLKPVLEMGRQAGLLHFDNIDEAFRVFFGLVVRDMQIRALLGEEVTSLLVDVDHDAERATKQFLALYSAANNNQ